MKEGWKQGKATKGRKECLEKGEREKDKRRDKFGMTERFRMEKK